MSLSLRHVLPVLGLAALGLTARPAQAQFGTNLVVNGNAEAGPGSASGNDIEPVPGFTTSGNFTVVQYDSSFFVLVPADPGKNYFAGGPNNASSSAMQLVNVTSGASAIDGGGVTFTLSGSLGGFDGQDDNAVFTANFLGASSNTLGSALIGPVTSADRSGLTGLLFRSASGSVPVGTRSINLTLQMTRLAGSYNDGYADNLSLVLTPNGPPPPAGVPEPSQTAAFGLGLLGLAGLMLTAKKRKASAAL